MRNSIQIVVLCVGLIGALLVGSCASSAKKVQLTERYPVWPASPAEAKIKLVNIFSTSVDLNIGKGFWQWLGEVFLGSDVEEMVRPMAIVVINEQQIFVADPGVHGVHLFDLKEDKYRLIKLSGNRNMLSPVALAAASHDVILITDSKAGQVYRYQYGDESAFVVDLDEELLQPTGIIVDEWTNEIYITDTKRHQIIVFDESGGLVRFIGRRGDADGELNFPTMIGWGTGGELLVTDSLNFRIQVFSKNGRYLSKFGEQGDATGYQSRPKGVVSDHRGNIYVVDSLFHSIQVFDLSGQYLLSVGEQGQAPGQFWLPTGIFINDEQKIYVADSYNKRVQVFQLVKAKR